MLRSCNNASLSRTTIADKPGSSLFWLFCLRFLFIVYDFSEVTRQTVRKSRRSCCYPARAFVWLLFEVPRCSSSLTSFEHRIPHDTRRVLRNAYCHPRCPNGIIAQSNLHYMLGGRRLNAERRKFRTICFPSPIPGQPFQK